MRLVTFSTTEDPAPRAGVLCNSDTVISLADYTANLPFYVTDVISVIEGGQPALEAVAGIKREQAGRGLALSNVLLHAPIPRPRKNVFCVGWNYLEHFDEGKASRATNIEMPSFATFFTKAPTTVNGPNAPVPAHAHVTSKLDWEAELALVIGKAGRDIAEADAMNHIFGYMVANDVSAREIQRQHGQQWFKGKSLDGHLPMGPWITTAEEVADPHNLDIFCKVNGVVKQQSNTRYMYFKLPSIIAQLSQGLMLEPGDVILTGTPQGVGHARQPPEFIRIGDVLETEVSMLGTLRNTIIGASV